MIQLLDKIYDGESIVAHNVVASECNKLGAFYVGGTVYECQVKKMNKRLLLSLYDRSGLGAYMPVDLKGHELEVEEHMEKFAKLILKECFQYLENEEDRLWDLSEKEEDPIFQSNFEICAEKCRDVCQGLKDHFGVEE